MSDTQPSLTGRTDEQACRILVVGCGAIGGTVAASLTYLGYDVTPLTRNELIADAVNQHGFRTQGEQSLGTVLGHAVTELAEDAGPFDFVLLATQPPQVEEAARQVVAHLATNGQVVVFQNGLCEARIADIVGEERVIGAIIAWGATMTEPGAYDRTSAGGFVLGRPNGIIDAPLEQLGCMLEAVGPVDLTGNLMGARWSKLAINCAISTLGTLGGERLGVLLRKRIARRLALEIMTEAVAVARAEGVELEKVAGTLDLAWLALTDAERSAPRGSASLVAKHALMLAVGTRYRRLRSSMLNAIERGRSPAVEFINGEVVERGERHGIPTPVNREARDSVWRIARGQLRPSIDVLHALLESTRPPPPSRPPLPLSDPPPSDPSPGGSAKIEGGAPSQPEPCKPGPDEATGSSHAPDDDAASPTERTVASETAELGATDPDD